MNRERALVKSTVVGVGMIIAGGIVAGTVSPEAGLAISVAGASAPFVPTSIEMARRLRNRSANNTAAETAPINTQPSPDNSRRTVERPIIMVDKMQQLGRLLKLDEEAKLRIENP